MTPTQRILKRTLIIISYVIMISLIAAVFYFAFRQKPTCSDGIQNQREAGIDCGGPCQKKCESMPVIQNVNVVEKYLITAGQNQYDALIKIKNPNALFGIANFDYSFDFIDKTGKVVDSKTGSTFLLPAQEKYVFAFNVNLPPTATKAFNFRIKSFNWQRFTSYEEPDIAVYQKEFNFSSGGSDFAQLKAKIQNRTNFDFKKITTRVIVRDVTGRPVAINETNNNDVKMNEEREVTFNWSNSFSQEIDPQNIEIRSEANIFGDDNFMKVFGSPEQYNSYNTGIDGQ